MQLFRLCPGTFRTFLSTWANPTTGGSINLSSSGLETISNGKSTIENLCVDINIVQFGGSRTENESIQKGRILVSVITFKTGKILAREALEFYAGLD